MEFRAKKEKIFAIFQNFKDKLLFVWGSPKDEFTPYEEVSKWTLHKYRIWSAYDMNTSEDAYSDCKIYLHVSYAAQRLNKPAFLQTDCNDWIFNQNVFSFAFISCSSNEALSSFRYTWGDSIIVLQNQSKNWKYIFFPQQLTNSRREVLPVTSLSSYIWTIKRKWISGTSILVSKLCIFSCVPPHMRLDTYFHRTTSETHNSTVQRKVDELKIWWDKEDIDSKITSSFKVFFRTIAKMAKIAVRGGKVQLAFSFRPLYLLAVYFLKTVVNLLSL